MGRKRKEDLNQRITLKCEKCGYIPEPDKLSSTEQWKVFLLICPKCKNRISINFTEGDV